MFPAEVKEDFLEPEEPILHPASTIQVYLSNNLYTIHNFIFFILCVEAYPGYQEHLRCWWYGGRCYWCGLIWHRPHERHLRWWSGGNPGNNTSWSLCYYMFLSHILLCPHSFQGQVAKTTEAKVSDDNNDESEEKKRTTVKRNPIFASPFFFLHSTSFRWTFYFYIWYRC